MIHVQSTRHVMLEPASFTNGATASVVIDRLNYDYASIAVLLGRTASTSNIPAVYLQEADVTNSSSFATISTFSTTQCNPSKVATAAGTEVKIDVDCRNRKRYLQLVVNPVTTEVVGAVAILSRPDFDPTNAVDMNVNNVVIG